MLWLGRHSLLLRRYVLSIICFVLIPIVALLLVYYSSVVNALISEVESTTLMAMDKTIGILDSDTTRFIETCYKISTDSHLTPYALRSNTYASVESIQRLGIYATQLDFAETLMLYLYGEERLYTAEGVISLDVWLDDGRLDGSSIARYRELLNSRAVFSISPPEAYVSRAMGLPVITLCCPWMSSNGGSFGTIACTVSERYLARVFDSSRNAALSDTFVVNAQGALLYRSGNAFAAENVLDLTATARDRSAVRIKREGQAASLLMCVSEKTGWRYMAILPHAPLIPNVFALHSSTTMIIMCILLVCVVAGIFIAYRLWLPIYQLNAKYPQGNGRKTRENELEALAAVMQRLDQEARQRMLESMREAERQSLIFALLSGSAAGDAGLERRLQEAGIVLDAEAYGVIVLTSPCMNMENRVRLLNLGREAGQLYAADMVYKNYIALLYGAPAREEASVREELVRRVMAVAKGGLFIGIGGLCTRLRDVNRCFTEAVLALESMPLDSGSEGIMQYQMPKEAKIDVTGKVDMAVKMLAQGIRRSSDAVIAAALDQLRDMMEGLAGYGRPLPLQFARSIVAYHLSLLSGESAKGSDAILGLLQKESLEEFITCAGDMCAELSSEYRSRGELSENDTYRKVVAFLDEHICDQDMSLTMLADRFDMSMQYMSRFFYKRSGVNFIDYLSQKRMGKACELLMTTDLSIRSIVEKVGYLNVPSFTRKFSEIYGKSPGKYRSANKPHPSP